jgi:hypothetical protein
MGHLILHHPLFHFYLAYVGVLLVVVFCTRERPPGPPRTAPQDTDPDAGAVSFPSPTASSTDKKGD